MPYIHQVIDLDTADGNWACGPTSVAMVLAYYGKLVPWPVYQAEVAVQQEAQQAADAGTTTAASIMHTPAPRRVMKAAPTADAGYAPYITDAYTYDGHSYTATAPDPLGNRVAGLYGTICPTGFADWSRMEQVFQWHGLSSALIPVTWDSILAALKRKHPVILGNELTPLGHILVVVGYTANGNLIVNDPYGNRFAAGYGGTAGEDLQYPWTCTRARTALEVIGVYPPPPPPVTTITPTHTPTATSTLPPGQQAAALGANATPSHAVASSASTAPADAQVMHGFNPAARDALPDRTAVAANSPGAAPNGGKPARAGNGVSGEAFQWWMLPVFCGLVLSFGLFGRSKVQRRVAVKDEREPEIHEPTPVEQPNEPGPEPANRET